MNPESKHNWKVSAAVVAVVLVLLVIALWYLDLLPV